MSFVICFGVSRGVQMVFRYPPEGVGSDLYGRDIPMSSDLVTTLGVRTDHLSFLLCPQQIREIPEHDVISVEAFSFHVRYFHIPVGPIKHLAIVVATENMDGKGVLDAQHRFSSFLDAYTSAIIREQNRCDYLRVAASQLTVKRDQYEDKGSWTTVFNAVSDLSLVHELVSITNVLQAGGSLRLHVNNWLYLEGEITLGDGLSSLSQDIQKGPREENSYIYLMIHSDLPFPLEKEVIEKAAEIVKEVSLPELLTLVAVPTSVQDFRKRIERKLAKSVRQTQSSEGIYGKEKEELLDYVTFYKLLQFLVSRGITKILRTYYVFQPLLFATASQQAISRRNQKVPKQHQEHDHQQYEQELLEQELADQEQEQDQEEGLYLQQQQYQLQQQSKHERQQQQAKQNTESTGNNSVRFLSGARDDRKRVVTTNRLNVEKHMTFLEMITRHSKLCPGVTSVDVIGNLRSTIDFFDGKTPKEEILGRIPSLSSSALDEVVTVFNEFIATVIA